MKELPEIKLARKIVAKHSLEMPFDLDKLVKEYATLLYKPILIEGVDGISIHLKSPGKLPVVVINSSLPSTRQRFTLAHELGHIIIPWHLGTIVDEIFSKTYKSITYSLLEQEANRFASELLMPKEWVLNEYSENADNLALFHEFVASTLLVSDLAAAIRLCQLLPPNIVYDAEENGIVSHSGKTGGTNAFTQTAKSAFDKKYYQYYENHFVYEAGSAKYHWWTISDEVILGDEDSRSWREILDVILTEIQPEDGIKNTKMSISGIIGSAYSNAKREAGHSLNSVTTAIIHRLRRPDLKDFTSHPDFIKFVKNRARDLYEPNN